MTCAVTALSPEPGALREATRPLISLRSVTLTIGRCGWRPENLLDIEYLAAKVQPLLAIEGPDGRSCFNCHSNHTILNLQPPDATGAFSAEVTANNYRSALRVVNLEDPEQSLLLRKPRSAGVLTPETGLSHVGGIRWASKDHPAYQAILFWLNGLTSSRAKRSASNRRISMRL